MIPLPGLVELGEFLGHLLPGTVSIRPVEADPRGPLAEFVGAQQGRQREADTVEYAMIPGRAAFGLLVAFPGIGLGRGIRHRGAGKHMRVPAQHFVDDRRRYGLEVETPGLAGYLRVEYDLQQQVAQFVAQRVEVGPVDRIGHFVGFLDGVRRNAGEVLLQVPGAAGFRVAQRRHNFE